jgi:hypothetical protein
MQGFDAGNVCDELHGGRYILQHGHVHTHISPIRPENVIDCVGNAIVSEVLQCLAFRDSASR